PYGIGQTSPNREWLCPATRGVRGAGMETSRWGGTESNVITVEIPSSVAPLQLVMAVVHELSRDHGAIVAEVDVSTAGGVVTLLIPQPTSAARSSEHPLGEGG